MRMHTCTHPAHSKPPLPLQFFWYRALDRAFPGRALVNFLAKVPWEMGDVLARVAFGWQAESRPKHAAAGRGASGSGHAARALASLPAARAK